MKAPKTKLEAVCEKPGHGARVYLTMPHLDVEKKRLIATNGHALVVHPVELEEGDTSGPVPLDALRVIRAKRAGDSIALSGNAVAEGLTYPRPDFGGYYPDVDRVIPAKPDTPPTIVFDAASLLALAQAMTDKKPIVRVWVGKTPHDALYIEAIYAPGVVGVQMPSRDTKAASILAPEYKTQRDELLAALIAIAATNDAYATGGDIARTTMAELAREAIAKCAKP